ncbi:MAG: TonB-dependent receptor [Pseudomonadota bacterium]
MTEADIAGAAGENVPAHGEDGQANFAQGFSVPDITSILGNAFTVVDISDELLLEPQKVDNYEVGVRADFDRVQLSLSGFYNESDLGTNFSVDPEGFAVPVRAPQRNYGVEATLDWQPSDIWRLGGTFSWNEGENDENDDGDFIALSSLDIKPFKVSVYVENETTPGWTNRLELLGVGSRDRGFNARNDLGLRVDETDIDGYITLDFLSSIKLNPGTLTLGVTNLLNNQYLPAGSQTLTQPGIEARRVAAPGIRFSLGYSVEF